MEIYSNERRTDRKVQVQVKDPICGDSRSFTVHNVTVDELFNKIMFLIERLSKSDNDVQLVYYKGGLKQCQKEN